MLKPDKVFGMMLTLMIGNGLCWQLPVVAAALAKLRILSSGFMLRYWRHAVVVIVTVAAVVTPTWDPVNLSIVALPMMVLYFASIGIVALIERGNRARDEVMASERHQRHLELDADARRRRDESELGAVEAPEEAPSDEAGQPEADTDPTDRMNTD
jgi:Sec-independent protein secretion pathway component TatC